MHPSLSEIRIENIAAMVRASACFTWVTSALADLKKERAKKLVEKTETRKDA
jgi:hypothetical protein